MLLNESVDYLGKIASIGKQRTRKLRAPVNGSTFISGQSEPEFLISCRRKGIFADTKNAYFLLTAYKTDASNASLPGSIGMMAFCNRQTVETNSNQQLSRVDNWNVLMGMKATENFSKDLLGAQFQNAYGTSAKETNGAVGLLASGGTVATGKRYAIPLAFAGIAHQYMPCDGLEDIRIKLNLESALVALQQIQTGADGLSAGSVTFANCSLVMDEYEMSMEEYGMFIRSLPNNLYRITNTDWYHQSDSSIAANTTEYSTQITLNKRDVKNVYFCFRTASLIGASGALSLTSRNHLDITSYNVTLGGTIVGQSSVGSSSTSVSEAILEIMKSSGGILDTNAFNLTGNQADNTTDGALNNFLLAEGNATSDATCGHYFGKINFDRGFDNMHSLSGIDVTSGNFVLNVSFGAVAAIQRLDIFVEYWSSYEMYPGGEWIVRS